MGGRSASRKPKKLTFATAFCLLLILVNPPRLGYCPEISGRVINCSTSANAVLLTVEKADGERIDLGAWGSAASKHPIRNWFGGKKFDCSCRGKLVSISTYLNDSQAIREIRFSRSPSGIGHVSERWFVLFQVTADLDADGKPEQAVVIGQGTSNPAAKSKKLLQIKKDGRVIWQDRLYGSANGVQWCHVFWNSPHSGKAGVEVKRDRGSLYPLLWLTFHPGSGDVAVYQYNGKTYEMVSGGD